MDDKIICRSGEVKVLLPLILLLLYWYPQIKCFVLVNFGYFAKDILRKTQENLHLNCKTCFSSKKLPQLQNQKNWKKRGDLPIYNPIHQAANPPSSLYEETDVWQMETNNQAWNNHSSSIAHNLQQLHFLFLLELQLFLKETDLLSRESDTRENEVKNQCWVVN